jgi:hypothetical protein
MSLKTPGINTSKAEVTNISAHGLWLLTGGKELFLPYSEFPWFKNANIAAIVKLEESHPGHFYWPDLDVDLTEDMIEHPEKYPLKART